MWKRKHAETVVNEREQRLHSASQWSAFSVWKDATRRGVMKQEQEAHHAALATEAEKMRCGIVAVTEKAEAVQEIVVARHAEEMTAAAAQAAAMQGEIHAKEEAHAAAMEESRTQASYLAEQQAAAARQEMQQQQEVHRAAMVAQADREPGTDTTLQLPTKHSG